MRIGLSVYGTTYGMGIAAGGGRPLIRPRQLIDQALAAGLQGVEFPVSLLQGEDPDDIGQYAREKDVYICVAAAGYDPLQLIPAIEAGARMGAATVRTVVGGAKIGGDRRPLSGRWEAFMREVLAGLRTASKAAEQAGIQLAVENHQDLASEELLWLCEEIGSPAFGITLDAGNPLATAEDPIEFAVKVSPYLKNVHLKDYWVYVSEEGYRLVRCPLGQGVIDFGELFEIFSERCPNVTMSIEIGALEARHIRVLADDYWPEYPQRSAAQFARVLRFAYMNAKSPGDWRTPLERGDSAEAIIEYENRQLEASLAYILPLFQRYEPLR